VLISELRNVVSKEAKGPTEMGEIIRQTCWGKHTHTHTHTHSSDMHSLKAGLQ